MNGLDPARIERLRSPERLEYFHPDRIWEILQPAPDCTLIDIGAGVGFLTLPFAERFPDAHAHGCDILEGMVSFLREDADARGLGNLETRLITNDRIDLPDDCADIVVMAQVHHEIETPAPLMAECNRLLKPGGTIAIIDWKDEENGKSPRPGRRVPVARMRADLEGAGFTGIETHDVYEFHTFMTGKA